MFINLKINCIDLGINEKIHQFNMKMIKIRSLVIDSNVIMAAFIRDNISRRIILDYEINLIAPDFILLEIESKKSLILSKSGLNQDSFDLLLSSLSTKIKIIPKKDYEPDLNIAKSLIGERDINDVSYLALAIAKDYPIWTNDKDFHVQKSVKIYTTKQVIDSFVQQSNL